MNNIEYSVPGNIHFAYIGVASGFPGWEIQAGAGYAEITDPAHDVTDRQFVEGNIPLEFYQIIGWTPWNLSTINFGDELKDHNAVTFGIRLYEKFKGNMAYSQFTSELTKYIRKFSRYRPSDLPVGQEYSMSWPYPVGYFNNTGYSYIPPGK